MEPTMGSFFEKKNREVVPYGHNMLHFGHDVIALLPRVARNDILIPDSGVQHAQSR
jgi:hypothetical protein